MYLTYVYLLLGQAVAIVFLTISKQRRWGLLWRPYIAALTINVIGLWLGGLAYGLTNSEPIHSDESLLVLPLTVIAGYLMQFFLFPVVSGPMFVGVLTVAILAWFVRGVMAYRKGKFISPFEEPLVEEDEIQPISELRYAVFVFGLLTVTALSSYATYTFMQSTSVPGLK
ncbi:MAG: hypothetical protein KF752_04875 [Pirellulaceae bacterium]|nr:hypothetical protein [Pirellulaceae bacterium]